MKDEKRWMIEDKAYKLVSNLSFECMQSCDTEFDPEQILYAVYSCGCTDCFMSAIFANYIDAVEYGRNHRNPEGFSIKPIKLVKNPFLKAVGDDCMYINNDTQAILSKLMELQKEF